jgi:hypothetical protein
MEKIKIYQDDDSSFISDPKDYGFIIRERDHPELMRPDNHSNYLNKKDYGEKVRVLNQVTKRTVYISIGKEGPPPFGREDFIMEELSKKEIPYKLCNGPHGYWLQISRKYFEVHYFEPETKMD